MIYPIVTQTGFAKLLFKKKDFTKIFNTLIKIWLIHLTPHFRRRETEYTHQY